MILVRIYLTTVLAFAAFNFACWSFWPYLAPAGQEWGSMIVGAFPRKLLVCKLHILHILWPVLTIEIAAYILVVKILNGP